MIRLRSMRPTLAVLLAAVLIVAAGGAAVASNMGFKFNKPLVKGSVFGNWTAIPYNNPYGTFLGLCTQTGLTTSGFSQSGITIKNYNEPPYGATLSPPARCSNQLAVGAIPAFAACTTDADCPASGAGSPFFCAEGFRSFNCGQTTGPINNTQTLIKGKGFQINQPVAGVSNIIIVGSHDPAKPILLKKNVDLWYSVPYHGTAITTTDLCVQATLTATGFGQAGITRLIADGTPPSFKASLCGATTTVFNLVLGEMIQVREPTQSTVNWVPRHF